MYGACLPRFRRSDFEQVEHHDGVSPAWPFSYDDLEPFYSQAEQLLEVHGSVDEDPTEPPHSTDYPYPPLPHEPAVERFANMLYLQGLHPFTWRALCTYRRLQSGSPTRRPTARPRRPAIRVTLRIAPSGPLWSRRPCGCCSVRTYDGCIPAPTVTLSKPQRPRSASGRSVSRPRPLWYPAARSTQPRCCCARRPAAKRIGQLLRAAGPKLHGPQQHLLHGREPDPTQ